MDFENDKKTKEEKDRFLTIINNLEDGLIFFDRENKLLLANSSIQNFFEVKEEDILGKSIVEFSEFPVLKNLFFLLGKDIKEVLKKELEVKEDLILEVTTIPVLSQGEKTGTLVIAKNVTREKTLERMKTEFVSVASHQLRTPLSAIRWALERLSKEEQEMVRSADQKKIIENALNSTRRMVVVLNAFLSIARIEEGKYLGKVVPVNLEEVIQGVVNSHQDIIEKKQIKFEFQVLDRDLPEIKADPEMITLSVQSLLDNAIRYTPENGIISIVLKSSGRDLNFSIEDTGIGIPENQQENIFKKFFRAQNAIKTEPEGNGLSLFVVRNIIKAHQGKIWFESKEGKGTIFYFSLPLT